MRISDWSSEVCSSDLGRMSYQGDSDYHQWRNRQIEALDREYDDYRRERQSRFESDFGGWRQQRATQRQHLTQARENMEVVGSDGEHVGKVRFGRAHV